MIDATHPRLKELNRVRSGTDRHWVGDGFPVRTLFAYDDRGAELSPFLLLDYAGPAHFPPTTRRLGVGEHPHRGFETVTLVYEGEVEHRDSSGGGGRIGPGDVQWMTAASGIVHEEFHGREFAARGGDFEMVQLWVNLPAKDKLAAPRYQSLTKDRIPEQQLPGGGGSIRVIAGAFGSTRGPAETFSPLHLWDLRLDEGGSWELPVPEGHSTLLVVLRGRVEVPGAGPVGEATVAVFGRKGEALRLRAGAPTTALLLAGEPIDEPIVGRGPFVMNSSQEIQQAMDDYRNGRMGHLG